MNFSILHKGTRRFRVHMHQVRMSAREADILLYYLKECPGITEAKVYERTCDAAFQYSCSPEEALGCLKRFSYEEVSVPEHILSTSGREMNTAYKEKLLGRVLLKAAGGLFLPVGIRNLLAVIRSAYFLKKGVSSLLKGKIEVSVLDATAITAAILRREFSTASSIMFLLGIGDLVEEWTHKKSVGDLARTLSLNVGKVWKKESGTEQLVSVSEILPGDQVIVRMGNMIPFDGVVVEGEANVNQASLTGESLSAMKKAGDYVYAGTLLEEGELTLRVEQAGGASRFEKIMGMIEETERLKSSEEAKAGHLADALVPWSLLSTGLIYLLTRNVNKAMAVLMVDFSCALKLAMPISVLSAIREAGEAGITVKGGKFLEAIAEADTIIFDKTGTLTQAKPKVSKIIPFNRMPEEELLRIAACLEEHFPHSIASAVVQAAEERGLTHEEMHTKVEYVVAHGISTTINGKRVIIGSSHFVFEDEGAVIPRGKKTLFKQLPEEYTHLFLAINGTLAAVLCIEGPLRPEAAEVMNSLRSAGFSRIIMMTGDNEKTAASIAREARVDEYHGGVLPADKARLITELKAAGHKVIMVGDGVNDSPALSAADAGIAILEGAEIAREIADVTIEGGNLTELITLKQISCRLMERIRQNYRVIVGFNLGLILLGVAGIMPNALSAFLHNASTLAISVNSMSPLQDKRDQEKRLPTLSS